jgi:hypothetical protein
VALVGIIWSTGDQYERGFSDAAGSYGALQWTCCEPDVAIERALTGLADQNTEDSIDMQD